MDIFEFAMEKERYAENYYRELADKTADHGLKSILLLLANDEVKHCETIKRIKDEDFASIGTIETDIIPNSKQIFQKMREAKDDFDLDVSEIQLFTKAQKFEKNSQEYYAAKAEEATDKTVKSFLLKLAEEEKKHFILLENIITMLQRPKLWLENAEFNNLDAY